VQISVHHHHHHHHHHIADGPDGEFGMHTSNLVIIG
jgi:hypothetical protein